MEAPMNIDTTARSDLDALTALNRDYIHSVQHGDVRRFDEILAEDFLCSNPDGSLVDKKQFLAQTAGSERSLIDDVFIFVGRDLIGLEGGSCPSMRARSSCRPASELRWTAKMRQ